MQIYYEQDAPLTPLKGKKIAVIGFGSQGHSQALNLRDSGLDVVVAEVKGSPNYDLAKEYGFEPVTAAEAAAQGDLIQILAQDDVQAVLYQNEVKPHMKAGKTLLFSHGFNIHYGQIVPPPEVDVAMVAPKGPGHLVRQEYEKGAGRARSGGRGTGRFGPCPGRRSGLRQRHRRGQGRRYRHHL